MGLANMRPQGVYHLIAFCHNAGESRGLDEANA